MKNKKGMLLIIIALILVCLVMCFITKFDVTNYTIESEKIPQEFDNFKIVQLSDFHSEGYRDTTEKLISKIRDINPDIVVMTGDMVSWDMDNIEEAKILGKSIIITNTAAREAVEKYEDSVIIENNEEKIYEELKEIIENNNKNKEKIRLQESQKYDNSNIIKKIVKLIGE